MSGTSMTTLRTSNPSRRCSTELVSGTCTVNFGANVSDIRGTAQYKFAKADFWKVYNVLTPVWFLKALGLK